MWWLIVAFFAIAIILLAIKLHIILECVNCPSKVYLQGKTALITGANTGIGFELARDLASRGCAVIIADKWDPSDTVKRLVESTHNPLIFGKTVDFGSFDSVRSFAENVKKEVNKLDILINNVGIGNITSTRTPDGLQEISQVNYFSHFLLIHLLADLLIKSSPSRIIYTSSIAAYYAKLTIENLAFLPIDPVTLGSYANSKLAGAIMSRVLSKKLSGTGVTSNVFHPGIIKTKIIFEANNTKSLTWYLLMCWATLFGKDVNQGIQTVLYLATADEVQDVSGEFFMNCKAVKQPSEIYDSIFCNQIWELSEKLAKIKEHEKIEVAVAKLKVR